MKILLVEDNIALADRIKHQLAGKRYIVDVVKTGEEAIEHAQHVNYAVIVLDLGLPGMTGDTVCKKMRELGIVSPILILTGTDTVSSKVRLLDIGADDYLTKPFNSDELRARIGVLIRRQPSLPKKPEITYHDLVISTDERKVYRSGKLIPLRRKEFDILEYLVSHHGRVLTREMIVNHAWDANSSEWNSSVDVHIKHLRDKVDRPFKTHYIKTAYGLGYKVDAPD